MSRLKGLRNKYRKLLNMCYFLQLVDLKIYFKYILRIESSLNLDILQHTPAVQLSSIQIVHDVITMCMKISSYQWFCHIICQHRHKQRSIPCQIQHSLPVFPFPGWPSSQGGGDLEFPCTRTFSRSPPPCELGHPGNWNTGSECCIWHGMDRCLCRCWQITWQNHW